MVGDLGLSGYQTHTVLWNREIPEIVVVSGLAMQLPLQGKSLMLMKEMAENQKEMGR